MKSVVDEALEQCTTVEHVLVSRRVGCGCVHAARP